MSNNALILETLQAELFKASQEHGELSYFLLEAFEEGFPAAALSGRPKPHEVLDVFKIGDHMGAHVLCGSPASIDAFRRISAKLIDFVPPSFQQSIFSNCDYADVRVLNAILALDSRIGTKKHGATCSWFEVRSSDGEIKTGVVSFLPGSDAFDQRVLVPAKWKEGWAQKGAEIVKVERTRSIHDVFGAAGEAIEQLLLRQRMPPYIDDMRPTYTELVKLVWEIDDLVTAAHNAGISTESNTGVLGTEGDCGFMLAATSIKRYINLHNVPWDKLNLSGSGWTFSVFEAQRLLVSAMDRLYACQGWHDLNRISISNDRSKIPKIDESILQELKQISEVFRRDGLEALPRDAASLGTPQSYFKLSRPRLFVEDIESFSEVRRISADDVVGLLDNGFLNISEDDVQIALESILGTQFHKKDWGGEENDLFAPLNKDGKRIDAAFALNGRGKAPKVLRLKHCGKNGDQVVRLFQSPAQLFIMQSVGEVGEDVIKDMLEKVMYRQLLGQDVHFCVINGQDTARLLRAYGKL